MENIDKRTARREHKTLNPFDPLRGVRPLLYYVEQLMGRQLKDSEVLILLKLMEPTPMLKTAKLTDEELEKLKEEISKSPITIARAE